MTGRSNTERLPVTGRSNAGAGAVKSKATSPLPTTAGPVPGEEGGLLGTPRYTSALEVLKGVCLAPCRWKMCVLGNENACHFRRGRSPRLPFLKNGRKKKKPFTFPFSLGLRGQMCNQSTCQARKAHSQYS